MMAESNTKALWGNAAGVVTVLTAMLVVFSALREWAYFRVIGMDFIALLSPADYISGVMSWFPGLIAMFLLSGVVGLVLSRAEGFGVDAKGSDSSWPHWIHKPITYLLYSIAGMTVIVAIGRIVFVVDNPTIAEWIFLGMGCWLALSLWFLQHPLASELLSDAVQIGVIFGPIVASSFYFNGHSAALEDLAHPSGEYRIVHTTGEIEDDVQLLRPTSKGVIILRVAVREMSFLTYSSFDRIDVSILPKHQQDREIPVVPDSTSTITTSPTPPPPESSVCSNI